MNSLLPAERDELSECEAVIETGLQTFVEVGTALLKIRDGRLYKADHATFEDYCRERWGIERRHAYRLMDAATVVANVSDRTQPLPANIEQTRSLAPLPVEKQREAWSKAVESAPNGKPTARHVEAAVAEVTGRNGVGAAVLSEGMRRFFGVETVDCTPEPEDDTEPTNGHVSIPVEASIVVPANGRRSLWGDTEDDPEDAEAVVATAEPVSDMKWYKFFDAVNSFMVSLPRRGGVKEFARGWTRKQVNAAIANLQDHRKLIDQCIADFRELRP